MEVDPPPEIGLRRPMMQRAAQVLENTVPPVPEALTVQLLMMIDEGHLIFKEPDIFALTTTGILLGAPTDMPQA